MGFFQYFVIAFIIYRFINRWSKELVDKNRQASDDSKTSELDPLDLDPAEDSVVPTWDQDSDSRGLAPGSIVPYQGQRNRNRQAARKKQDTQSLEEELRAKLPTNLTNLASNLSRRNERKEDHSPKTHSLDQDILEETWSHAQSNSLTGERSVIRSDRLPQSHQEENQKGRRSPLKGDRLMNDKIVRPQSSKRKVSRSSLKQAVVWSEILQPPKSLR